jgi:phage portal protein BeeE
MGLASRIAGWFKKSTIEEWWEEFGAPGQSVTGLSINQVTALNSTAVLAAVTMLTEDVAKLPWSVFRHADDKSRT